MIDIFDANAVLRRGILGATPYGRMTPRGVYNSAVVSKWSQIWVWDGPHHNDRRRALYPPYKTRDYTGQEDVFAALEMFAELLSYSPTTQICVPNWEADDVCATLARKFSSEGTPCTVNTNDFDFNQLVGIPNVTVRGVKSNEDVSPSLTSAYKALRGDTSDTIPGLPGFGPKSWSALSEYHDQIDQALARRDTEALLQIPFKPSIRSFLLQPGEIEKIFTFYEITRMLDVPMDQIDEYSLVSQHNPAAAEALLERFML